MVITEITLCWYWMHIYPDVYFLFVFPHYGWQVPLTLVFMSSCFSFIFCSKFFSIPFLFGLTVPRHCTVLVCKSPNKETVHIVCVPHFPALQGVQLQLHEYLPLRDSHIACFCLNTLAYCTYIPYSYKVCEFWSQIYCVSLVCTVLKWLGCWIASHSKFINC